MAGRVPLQPLGLAMLVMAAPASAADQASILASYSFEDEVATGPDTFRIFEHAKGTVSLTDTFRLSGYRAIQIRDVGGDRDMPEIQGYFPLRTKGRLYAHFAFLTATLREEFNIALAGPEWFRLAKGGIAFWLKAEDGKLVHVSDSIPKKLFPLDAFVWYTADLAYDIEAGSYDLTIHQEGQADAVVDLRGQRNAPNQPGSAVDKFSFVGEPWGDQSNVTYYVDDIVIGTSERVKQLPFVAPGRRKLFVDAFVEYRKLEIERPRCLPAEAPEDFGLSAAAVKDLARQGLLDLLGGAPGRISKRPEREGPFSAIADWNDGCAALERGAAEAALGLFSRAAESEPRGRLYALSAILALVRLGRIEEADQRIGLLYPDWKDDPRYAVVAAMIGSARGDLEKAEAWLRDPAEEAAIRRAGRASEQYFYVLLWNGRHAVARDYALRVADRLQTLRLDAAEWIERAGDASFYARDLRDAGIRYEEALALHPSDASPLLKLADIAFLSGDLAAEKALRERVYGALVER